MGMGCEPQPEATDADVREAIADLEQDEATDDEVREAIFASESPDGQTAREVAAIEQEER